MSRARFAVLQTMLGAALVALWFNGVLDKPFEGEGRWFVAAVALVAFCGLVCVWIKRLEDARWIGDKLVPLAVVGMQVGIQVGLAALGKSMAQGVDAMQAAGGFLTAISAAFYVSVTALAGFLWISLTLKVTANED